MLWLALCLVVLYMIFNSDFSRGIFKSAGIELPGGKKNDGETNEKKK
jgi:hypothetical protein